MRNSSWFSASVEDQDHDAAQQENSTQSAGSANNRSVGSSEKNGGNHLLEHFGKRPIHEERPTSSSSVSIRARDSRPDAHGGGGVLLLDAHGGGGHDGRSLGGRGGFGPSEVPATFGRRFSDNSVGSVFSSVSSVVSVDNSLTSEQQLPHAAWFLSPSDFARTSTPASTAEDLNSASAEGLNSPPLSAATGTRNPHSSGRPGEPPPLWADSDQASELSLDDSEISLYCPPIEIGRSTAPGEAPSAVVLEAGVDVPKTAGVNGREKPDTLRAQDAQIAMQKEFFCDPIVPESDISSSAGSEASTYRSDNAAAPSTHLHQMAPPSRQQHISPRFLPTRMFRAQPQDAQPVLVSCLRSRSVPPPQEHGTSSAAVAISRIERRNRSVDFADGCELIFVDQRSPSRARLHPTNEAEESVPLPTARGTEQLQRIRRGSPYSTPTPGMMLFYQRNRGSFPVARASQIVPTEHGKGAVAQLATAPGGQWCTSLFFDCAEPGGQAQDKGPDDPDSSREQRETGATDGGSPDSMVLTVSNACTVNGNSSSSIFSEVLARTGALHDARAYAETDPFALPAEVGCFCLCASQPPPRRILFLRIPNPKKNFYSDLLNLL